MSNDVLLFVLIALCAACIGAASGLVLADFIAVVSLVWAWVVYETEDESDGK